MSTFAEDILDAAGDEPILAIVVSPSRGGWRRGVDHTLGSLPVAWEVAKPVLDYDYDAGYGSQDCHEIWAWTPTRVLFVHEYDGSTSIVSVPRDPEHFKALKG